MAITRVKQVGTAQSATAGTTLVITVPAGGVALGHHIIMVVSSNTNPAEAISVADTGGNTYQVDRVHDHTGTSVNVWIISAKVTTALVSGNTITISGFTGSANRGAIAYEYSSIPTASWVDQVNSAQGLSVTTHNSGNITTTQAEELLVGGVSWSAQAPVHTPDAGWTELVELSVGTLRKLVFMERIVSSTGTYASSGTFDVAANPVSAIASYKGLAGTTITPPQGVIEMRGEIIADWFEPIPELIGAVPI